MPEALRSLSLEDFWARFGELGGLPSKLYVLRLSPMKCSAMSGILSGMMCVRRRRSRRGSVSVSRTSPLGRVSGADSCFEIYTESYGSQPDRQSKGRVPVLPSRHEGVFGASCAWQRATRAKSSTFARS